ncbi:nucleotidyltransferase substrate binding protein [Terrihalobacillus insolitus]|uniref:nucleotidyltransferase substrate binding protein n=1 Tax=Terrihalobacillus insolitus TaxID=2950438 RepID=UPI002341F4AC|nr:nucleotidyltransferase substrate binding protein [Terrihalobacillus insolitus]MDC3415210.1 nucleotidyltransferase substrate binding protein [Terrihalobacillus insolitus]
MSQEMINQSLVNLGKALNRLEEAVEGPVENQLMIDGVIQRFEFTIEQFWKTLKRILKSEGIQTSTPKESLQQAYKVGWINDEKMWLSMLKDRNLTSNTYDENVANEIYQRIKLYTPEMRRIYNIIKNYSTD